MGALLGGGQQQQQSQPSLAVSPGEAAGLTENMYADAGVGGVGRTPSGQMTGSPTPDLQYDMAGIAAGAANQGALTNAQLALLQGNQAAQLGGTQGANAGFNTTPSSGNANTGTLGTPAGGDGGDPVLT
jgi:hypothetical protein